MTRQEHILRDAAAHEVDATLRLLHLRATYGTRAKPTIKELNEILDRLTAASKHLREMKEAGEANAA